MPGPNTPSVIEAQALSGSASSLFEMTHQIIWTLARPQMTTPVAPSIFSPVAPGGSSAGSSPTAGVEQAVRDSGIAGPNGTVCYTAERHEDGKPQTRICASQKQVLVAGNF